MYLHLGLDTVVPSRDVVGIFDLDNTTTAAATRALLETAEQSGRSVTVGTDLPKAFILCSDRIYISQLSPRTLVKRVEKNT